MYEKIDDIISKAIQAINDSEQEIANSGENWGNSLINLHLKMTEIKPLKSLKEEYSDFYKKLSGLGKIIEESNIEVEANVETPKLFDEKDIKSIE
jgi:hypothetical protein